MCSYIVKCQNSSIYIYIYITIQFSVSTVSMSINTYMKANFNIKMFLHLILDMKNISQGTKPSEKNTELVQNLKNFL